MSRSKLPAELREALRAAERLDGRRGGRARRAVMACLAAVLCVAGAAGWYAVEGGGVPGLPRVVYGIPEGKPELDGRALVLPRVTYGTPAGTAEPDGRARFTARVSVVDVSEADSARKGNGHGYLRGSPWVSSDLLMSLAYGLPPAERGLVRKAPGVALWTFPPDYIPRLRVALLKQQ